MAMKTKTFDCVDMKRHAQERLLAEYETHKGKYASYWEFLKEKSKTSPWQTVLWKKFQGEKPKASI